MRRAKDILHMSRLTPDKRHLFEGDTPALYHREAYWLHRSTYGKQVSGVHTPPPPKSELPSLHGTGKCIRSAWTGPFHWKHSNAFLGHEILALSTRSRNGWRPRSWKCKNLQDLSTLLFTKHRMVISSKAYKVCFLLSLFLNFLVSITWKKTTKNLQKEVSFNVLLSLHA